MTLATVAPGAPSRRDTIPLPSATTAATARAGASARMRVLSGGARPWA